MILLTSSFQASESRTIEILRAKMTAKLQSELVIIPSPGRGHLQATLELANLLIDRDDTLSISMLVIKPFFGSNKVSSVNSQQYSPETSPRIRLIDVPPSEYTPSWTGTHPISVHQQFIHSHRDNVRDEVAKIIQDFGSDSKLAGFIVDMFCTTMIDVANEFGVPTYVFFTSGASCLGLMFHIQSMIEDPNQDVMKYENSDTEISVPSYRFPVPGKQLPPVTFDITGGKEFYHLVEEYKEAKGILVNTFLELESHGMKSLSDDEKIPPVYSIGPLIHSDNRNEDNPKYPEIMNWLDQQPDSSVVFLCFGSMGSFNEIQVKEIALALEQSGHRFLWSLRKPPPQGTYTTPSEYENPEEVLPVGFLQRTAGIGKVIGWAPQFAVLSHSAIGGFVSHCGWNSTLESVWCGVPIGVWPLYAEQSTNAFQLVKDLGIGVEIKMDYKKGSSVIVSAAEIETGLRVLMDPASQIRSNIESMKWKSRAALSENGSSFEFVGRFLSDVKGLGKKSGIRRYN